MPQTAEATTASKAATSITGMTGSIGEANDAADEGDDVGEDSLLPLLPLLSLLLLLLLASLIRSLVPVLISAMEEGEEEALAAATLAVLSTASPELNSLPTPQGIFSPDKKNEMNNQRYEDVLPSACALYKPWGCVACSGWACLPSVPTMAKRVVQALSPFSKTQIMFICSANYIWADLPFVNIKK